MVGRGDPAPLAAALFLAVGGAQAASYGIVLDCGSTGTRVNIFYWEDPGGAVSQFTPTDELDEAALKASPGISSFSENPELLTTLGLLFLKLGDNTKAFQYLGKVFL